MKEKKQLRKTNRKSFTTNATEEQFQRLQSNRTILTTFQMLQNNEQKIIP